MDARPCMRRRRSARRRMSLRPWSVLGPIPTHDWKMEARPCIARRSSARRMASLRPSSRPEVIHTRGRHMDSPLCIWQRRVEHRASHTRRSPASAHSRSDADVVPSHQWLTFTSTKASTLMLGSSWACQFADGVRGAIWRPWNSRPWPGSTGSTRGGCSSQSVTCRRRSTQRSTINRPQWLESTNLLSQIPGTVQYLTRVAVGRRRLSPCDVVTRLLARPAVVLRIPAPFTLAAATKPPWRDS